MNTKEGETNIQRITNRVKKDSKKNTKRQKPDSTNTDNHQTKFISKIEQIANKWEGKLSLATHRRLSNLHPALVSHQLFLDIMDNLSRDVRQQLKKYKGTQKELQLFNEAIRQFQAFLERAVQEKQKVVVSIPNTRLMENPKDKQNSYISIMYQHEINEMKDIFERKKNFKDYASDNLMKNKKYLECLISKRVGKVKCNLINQRFLEHHGEKIKRQEDLQAEWRRKEKQQVLSILKSMDNAARLKIKLQKAKRTEDIERDLTTKANIVQGINSQRGYFQTLHDHITLI